MAYNKAREEKKWWQWKEAEEKIMRQCGIDEKTIEQLHIDDWAVFNSDRRFYEKLQEVGTYLDDVVRGEQRIEINTVEDFLNDIGNEEIVHLTPNAIYGRMDTLRKRLRKTL